MTELSKFLMGAKRWQLTRFHGSGMTPKSAGSHYDYFYQEVLIPKNGSTTFSINSPEGEYSRLTHFSLHQPLVAVTNLVIDGRTVYNGRGIGLQPIVGLVEQVFTSFTVTIKNYHSTTDRDLEIAWQNVKAVKV